MPAIGHDRNHISARFAEAEHFLNCHFPFGIVEKVLNYAKVKYQVIIVLREKRKEISTDKLNVQRLPRKLFHIRNKAAATNEHILRTIYSTASIASKSQWH